RRPDSFASLSRRAASSGPCIVSCPASPLVTDTNLTAYPNFAKSAAVPAARISQSSGCAPNAITRISLLFCPRSIVAAVKRSTSIFIYHNLRPVTAACLMVLRAPRLKIWHEERNRHDQRRIASLHRRGFPDLVSRASMPRPTTDYEFHVGRTCL